MMRALRSREGFAGKRKGIRFISCGTGYAWLIWSFCAGEGGFPEIVLTACWKCRIMEFSERPLPGRKTRMADRRRCRQAQEESI